MKIRIKGNSVRIRLGKSEVDCFAETGEVSESNDFGGGNLLRYSLQKSATGESLSAKFDSNVITLYMPENLLHEWATTERVGFDANMPIGNGSNLFLLVEKDWKCLDTTNEDQSDMFANPNEACG